MQLLGYPVVLGSMSARVLGVVARVPGWLLRCCYGGCYGTWGGC